MTTTTGEKPKGAELHLTIDQPKIDFNEHSLGIHLRNSFTHVSSIAARFRSCRKQRKTQISCKNIARSKCKRTTATNARHKVECTLTFKSRGVSNSHSPRKHEKIV